MNIAYCEDEKIQLEYMEQLIRKWADEGNDTVTYFGYGSAKELLFEHIITVLKSKGKKRIFFNLISQ